MFHYKIVFQVEFNCDVDYTCMVNSIRWYHTTPDNLTTTQLKVSNTINTTNTCITTITTNTTNTNTTNTANTTNTTNTTKSTIRPTD